LRIIIVSLEPLPQRYTCEWVDNIPKMIRKRLKEKNLHYEVYNILGQQTTERTSKGSFLNFAATNIWKNTQTNTICENFINGYVSPGDKFFFTDAWNTGILQLRYMSQLLDIPVEIHGLWHAGSFDEHDLLGQKIIDKRWSYNTERAIYYACDYNYFGTEFLREMFETKVLGK
jgi:hypothetical protein